MSKESVASKKQVLDAVIINVKRLLDDAGLMQEHGSAGSALSLAVLAFEEAGKGHAIEHNWVKPKHMPSHHSFRHFIAFLVLQASFTQKYELNMAGVQKKIAARFKELDIKPGSRTPLPPMSDDLREALREELLPQLANMSDDQKTIFGIEQRWLGKIAEAVKQGQLEKIRQSGLYVDSDAEFAVTSNPVSVTKMEAERWIWAATRVLNLLEGGIFYQPYSPLAELITAANAGDAQAASALAAARGTALGALAKK